MLTCLLPNRSWQHQSQSPAAFLLKRAPSEGVHVHVQDETTLMTRHHYHYHYHYHHHQWKKPRPCSQPTTWARRALVSVRRRERADTGFALLIFVGMGKWGKSVCEERNGSVLEGGGKPFQNFRIFNRTGIRVRVRKAGPSIEVVATLLVAACSL